MHGDETLKTIAVIPARGGSKRVPKKNIREIDGLPMIGYAIRAAEESRLFSHILVSTDSEEIASVSKSLGAEVPFLRNGNADDHTPISEATLGAVLQSEEYFHEKYDVVVQLMANCPNRTAQNILDGFKFFQQTGTDFALSCFKFGWMNPWWALKVDKEGNGTRIFQDTFIRSQDLPDLFCPTGAVWIANVDALKREKTFYGLGHKFFEIPWENAVDIDSEDDLKFADVVRKAFIGQ